MRAERFILGRIRGSTDRWPKPTREPEQEPTHPFTIPDDVDGPFGREDEDA
jgi:hypothetical protein